MTNRYLSFIKAALSKLVLSLCFISVPIFYGTATTLIGLITMQVLWLLNASRWICLFLVIDALVLGFYNQPNVVTWFIDPIKLMLKHHNTILNLPNIGASIVDLIWLQLGEGVLWKSHLPHGIFFGSGIMFLYRWAAYRKTKNIKKANFSPAKLLPLKQDKKSEKIEQADVGQGTLMGIDNYARSIILTDKVANQHSLILGTTGSGKTVTVCNIVESAINRSIPVIYIDGKGDDELAKRIAQYAKNQKRASSIFSMHEGNLTYNPLATGGFTSKKDRIIELREWTEEHYKKLAEGYLQSVFKVMEYCQIPCNLVTLAAHMDLKFLKSLVRKHANMIEHAEELMEELNYQEQASKNIESLIAEIRNFSNSEIGSLFRIDEHTPVLTIDNILTNKGVAYFSLPALEFPSMSKTLGKLIINDLKATIAKRWSAGEESKVYVIFDEFSVFAGEQVLNVINMGRSAGIHAVLCTQSLSDIASARNNNSNHFMNQVVGNCNNFILHRQNSPEDAEMLAQIIGTRNTLEYTLQLKDNDPTHTGTVKHIKGFITHPDEIKRLNTGEAYFFSKEEYVVQKIKVRRGNI